MTTIDDSKQIRTSRQNEDWAKKHWFEAGVLLAYDVASSKQTIEAFKSWQNIGK